MKQLRKFVMFMAKATLLTAESEPGFQIFVLEIHHKEMNQGLDARQTSIKELLENYWNAVL